MVARVSLILALLVGVARADEPKPWAAGVSDTEQAAALALYDQGNAEFQAARFGQALAKYTQALAHWDHPSIHFNMAVCLINLDQPLEARQHLERALAYGAEALGPEMYAQGLTYRHSLDGQIAHVTISCSEPGASITLDGVLLFVAPGQVDRFVLPGEHQVVATKPGFLTRTETLQLLPSKETRYDVHLIAFHASTTRLVRRWDPRMTYSVLGAGAGAVALGGLSYLLATNSYARYDAAVLARCPTGCDAAAAAPLEATRRRGDLEKDVALALFVAGGAATIAGVIGIVIDQPHVETPAVIPTAGGAILSYGAAF